MPALFDGIPTILSGVFGDPIDVTPAGGGVREIQGIFRRVPATSGDDYGAGVATTIPQLRAARVDVQDLIPGSLIVPKYGPDVGRQFRVISVLPEKGPAADGFAVVDLEEKNP